MSKDIKYVVVATKKDTGERGFVRIEEGGYPYLTPDFNPALLVYSIKYAVENANLVAEHFKDEFEKVNVVEITMNYEFTDIGLNIFTTTKIIEEDN
jgi:hypothetical protein